MIFIYQPLFTCRIEILWVWLAGVVFVAKSKFAVPAMIRHVIRRTKGSYVRSMSEEDLKGQNPSHFQIEYAQFLHYKLFAQCDAQYAQRGLSLQNNVIEQ